MDLSGLYLIEMNYTIEGNNTFEALEAQRVLTTDEKNRIRLNLIGNLTNDVG